MSPQEIELPACDIEILFVRVNECIIICCYYPPHQGDDITAPVEAFDYVAEKYPKDQLILTGNMNFPGFNWQDDIIKCEAAYKFLHERFLSFLCENDLTQVINEPTHIKGNTLDLICTNDTANMTAEVFSPGLSDHYLINVEIYQATSTLVTEPRYCKLYHKVNMKVFQETLWPTQCKLASMQNVSEMWELFSSELKRAVDKAVPTKLMRSKNQKQPYWFNRQADRLVAKHRKTYNRYKETGDPFYLIKYKQERRLHKAQLHMIKQSYITDKICKPLENGNSKPFYQHLKWTQGVSRPPMKLLTRDGSHTENAEKCADILNEFFGQQFCKQHQLTNVANYSGPPDCIEITTEGVFKLVTALKNGKAPGPDEIRKEDLAIDPLMTARCLTYIFRASLTSSKLPREWKLAHVTPLHKRGANDQPNNYRPISLTSIPCKILEHIVLHHLNLVLDKILCSRQHGFRQGLSCETQLCGTYHDLAKHADRGNTVHALVLDFAKAFDKVPHGLLMQKLSRIPGVASQILMWIHDFLLDRRQRVQIKGSLSAELSWHILLTYLNL